MTMCSRGAVASELFSPLRSNKASPSRNYLRFCVFPPSGAKDAEDSGSRSFLQPQLSPTMRCGSGSAPVVAGTRGVRRCNVAPAMTRRGHRWSRVRQEGRATRS